MKYTLANQTRQNDTDIIVGRDALEGLNRILSSYTSSIIITDKGTSDACLGVLREKLGQETEVIVLPGGENNKNLELAGAVLRRLRDSDADRKSLIIGLGGGVINDIAGFVASIYMRGIDWLMIPTTLTAQADAAIGGKTGVNLDKFKNMAGSFWPARSVLIDPGLLSSLSKEHLRNGLGEIIKVGFILDKQILGHIQKIDPSHLLGAELYKASELAAKAKIDIVAKDTYESGERKLLNFGHTVGHALETISLASQKPLLHGEAISIGMVAETKLAEAEGVCEQGLAGIVADTLKRFDLPITYKAELRDVLSIIATDKKNSADNIHWTLPVAMGQGKYDHIADQTNIKQAIQSVIS